MIIVTLEGSVSMRITADCEACQKQFSYTESIVQHASARTGLLVLYRWSDKRLQEKVIGGLQAQVRRMAERKQYPCQACPQCGYIQSWGRPPWHENLLDAAMVSPVVLLTGVLLGVVVLIVLQALDYIYEPTGTHFLIVATASLGLALLWCVGIPWRQSRMLSKMDRVFGHPPARLPTTIELSELKWGA